MRPSRGPGRTAGEPRRSRRAEPSDLPANGPVWPGRASLTDRADDRMDPCPDGRLEPPGGAWRPSPRGARACGHRARSTRIRTGLSTTRRGGSRGIARDQAEATIEGRGIRLDPAGDERGPEEAGERQDVVEVSFHLGGRAILPRGQVAGHPGAILAGEPGQGLEIDAGERLVPREGGGLPLSEAGAPPRGRRRPRDTGPPPRARCPEPAGRRSGRSHRRTGSGC